MTHSQQTHQQKQNLIIKSQPIYMYILLIFTDQECKFLNAMWLYDTIKDMIQDTNNVIRYSDVNKKTRVYKTAKSFFRILKVNDDDNTLYFK
jgi:hypothetical protein